MTFDLVSNKRMVLSGQNSVYCIPGTVADAFTCVSSPKQTCEGRDYIPISQVGIEEQGSSHSQQVTELILKPKWCPDFEVGVKLISDMKCLGRL